MSESTTKRSRQERDSGSSTSRAESTVGDLLIATAIDNGNGGSLAYTIQLDTSVAITFAAARAAVGTGSATGLLGNGSRVKTPSVLGIPVTGATLEERISHGLLFGPNAVESAMEEEDAGVARTHDYISRVKPHMSRYSAQRRAGTPLESLRPDTLLPWSSVKAELLVPQAWCLFTRQLIDIAHKGAAEHFGPPPPGKPVRHSYAVTQAAGNDEALDAVVRQQLVSLVPRDADTLIMSEGLAAGTAAMVLDFPLEPPAGTVVVVADVGSYVARVCCTRACANIHLTMSTPHCRNDHGHRTCCEELRDRRATGHIAPAHGYWDPGESFVVITTVLCRC
jgi:hypothetical protein